MSKEWTVSALEQMLMRKQAQLQTLTRRRDALLGKLAKIDEAITRLTGQRGESGFKVRRRIRRRPKNERPLTEVVMEVLEKNKPGLSLRDLAEQVFATGYKSNSGNFNNVLYQCLYNNRKTIVHDAKTGAYRLRKQ